MKPTLQSLFSGIFILIIFVSLNSSCKKCKTTSQPEHVINNYPTDDDLSWITFDQGDTLLFLSNQGNYDTVFINISPVMNDGPFEEGYYNSCETYYSNYKKIMAFNLLKNDGFASPIAMFISGNTPAKISPFFNANDWTTSQNFSLVGMNTSDLEVYGQMFNNVYEIVRDSLSLSSHSKAWRFYYQKENGLIRFDDIGGVVWERIN